MERYFDQSSAIGMILNIYFTWLGMITLNEYAIIIAIGVGVTTIGMNIVKTNNELKRGKMLSKEIEDRKEEETDEE